MRRVPLACAVASLALVAACGQRGSAGADPTTSASPTSSSSAASSGPWLLRFDAHVGEDGESTRATYVVFDPGTGKASAVTMPVVNAPQTSGVGDTLLVDAGHTQALVDGRPLPKDRERGVVRLHGLDGGAVQSVDVRAMSGDPQLKTDWVSFDPAKPGLLRVVSGSDVWTVDLSAKKAEKTGTLPSRPGWIYGGGFDKNTGTPFIEDTGSFDTDPPGNGENDTTPVVRAGGQVLDPLADQEYGTRPDPGCEVSAGFVAAGGDVWALCVDGRTLQAKHLAKDASSWTTVGKPSTAAVPEEADPVFALPVSGG